MHVEESEYLRLRKPNRVQHGSRFKFAVVPEFDHHLHAERPLSVCMPFGQPKVPIKLLPHGTDWSIGDNSQPSMNIHAKHETFAMRARGSHTLISEPNPVHLLALEQRFADRHARPNLHRARACDLVADP